MLGGSRAVAALLASCLVAGTALADPRTVSEKDKQAASDLVKKAIQRSQAGDHSAAIDIYLQAYTIVPNSILLSNIGAEYQQSGKQKEALRYFCLYLEKDPNGTNATYATAQAKAMRGMLGDKNVDDDEVCETPKAERDKDKDKDKDRPRADVDKRHKRDADDGEPKVLDDPPAVEATRGDDTTLRTAGFIVGGVGVAALGLGVYAGIEAKRISDEITNHSPDEGAWGNIHGLETSGQNWEYAQIGGLVAGGALVVTGVVLLVRSRGSGEVARNKTAIHVTPTRNGVAVFGQF